MRALLVLAWLFALSANCFAQPVGGMPTKSASASYVGPGDIAASATRWWGLRAYSKATAGNNAIQLQRTSDVATQNITTLASGALDVTTAATFCNATTCHVLNIYDQAGSGTSYGASTGPLFVLNCIGSKPCMRFAATNADTLVGNTAGARFTLSQPFSFSSVVKRTGATTSVGLVYEQDGGAFTQVSFNSAVNQIRAASTAFNVAATASDSNTHSFQWIFNGASSGINVDNTLTTGDFKTSGFSNGTSQGIGSGSVIAGSNLTGDLMEIGVWPSAFSPTTQTSMCHNQFAYWGTVTSC